MASALSRLRRESVVLVWTRMPRARSRSSPAQRLSNAPVLADDRVVELRCVSLEGELGRVEAGLGERVHALPVQELAVRDEVHLEAEALRVPHEARERRAQGRLAAREADAGAARVPPDHLQDPAHLVVAHHAVLAPALGEARSSAAGVAEGAGQVAAVGEGHLGEDRVGAEVRGEGLVDDGAPAVTLADRAVEPGAQVGEEVVDLACGGAARRPRGRALRRCRVPRRASPRGSAGPCGSP